jgi:hypothetical protein
MWSVKRNLKPILTPLATFTIRDADSDSPFISCKTEDKGYIAILQHAFNKNHSTASNHLECMCNWSAGLDSRIQTDVIYIDIAELCDSIVPSKLLFKLKLYDIIGRLLKWISVFLTGETRRFIIGCYFAPVSDIIGGVTGVPRAVFQVQFYFLFLLMILSAQYCVVQKKV